jgi:plastocyanin
MRSTARMLVATAVLALLLAGCGGNGGDAPDTPGAASTTAVTVVTTEFQFDPDRFSIPADTDVVVTIDNSGGVVEHDFTIDALDVDIYADPTQVVTGTINAPAGTYDFYCSIPGHREAGMVGVLTVG